MSVALSRRANIRLIAIIGLVGYAITRFLVVHTTFEAYGVNPWLFLAIDCATAVTYVLGIEHLVRGLMSSETTAWWRLGAWALLAGVSFAAPYVYIIIAGNEMPGGAGIGLIVVVLLLAANAVIGISKRIRKKNRGSDIISTR